MSLNGQISELVKDAVEGELDRLTKIIFTLEKRIADLEEKASAPEPVRRRNST